MKTVLLSLACALTVSMPARAASGLGDDPAKFDQLLDAAYLRHDVEFMRRAIADDALFTHSSGSVWTKQHWLDVAKTYNGTARNVDSVQVERHGNVIETIGHIQVKRPSPDPKVAEYHVYYVRLYVRGPEGWQFA